MSFRKSALVAAAALGLASAAASVAHAGLVVRSVGNGASAFPVGKTVSPGTPIQLGAGDMLTVLEGQTTRTFRGPGTFDVGRAAQATTTLAAASAALDARAAARKPRLGTVRGIPAIDAPSLWDVDLEASSSAQCVVDPANVTLRRASKDGALALTIAAPKGGMAKVTIPAGEASAAWPKDLPAMGSFTLKGEDLTRTLTFTKVPSPTGDPATDAEALIKAGCTTQLEKFVATLEKPAS